MLHYSFKKKPKKKTYKINKKTYLIKINLPNLFLSHSSPLSSCDWERKRSDVINLFHPNYERQSGRERRRKKSLITRKCWRGSGAPVCQLRSSWHAHTQTYTHILKHARTHTHTHTHTFLFPLSLSVNSSVARPGLGVFPLSRRINKSHTWKGYRRLFSPPSQPHKLWLNAARSRQG